MEIVRELCKKFDGTVILAGTAQLLVSAIIPNLRWHAHITPHACVKGKARVHNRERERRKCVWKSNVTLVKVVG